MHARVFRHITKRFSTISKTVLLALFLFAGIPLATHAQQDANPTAASLALTYSPYFDLFTTSSTGVVSGISSIKANNSLTGGGINGLVFTLQLGLDTSQEPAEEKWERASMGSSGEFLVQLCNNEGAKSCWIETVTVEDVRSVGSDTFAYRLFKKQDSSTYAGSSIASYTLFSNATHVKYLYDAEKNSITESNAPVFMPGETVTGSFWYCAMGTGASAKNAYETNKVQDDRITKFGTLCNGDEKDEGTYFRIGTPFTYTIPANAVDLASDQAAGQNAAQQKAVGVSVDGDNLPECGVTSGAKFIGCLAQLAYYGLYWPIAWVAGLFGSLFDFFIGYSVSDESYRYEFAVNGWRLVRDIANVFFIIIMVYVGFAAVFSFGGSGGSSWKKVVPILIFNALIINFSLFATRTVIDVSNITARVFYSRMVVCDGKCVDEDNNGTPENIKRSLGGHWPLSEKIVGAFDPQRMFGTVTLNPKETVAGGGGTNDPLVNSTTVGKYVATQQQKGFSQSEYAGYYALVSIIAAAIMLGIAAMFFNVTFMFVGRVIGLYMAMIFSPFAFLTRGGMPLLNIDRFSWKNWLSDLFKYAALAPVFTFFLYIVYSFLNTDIVKQIGVEDKTGGFFGTVLSIVIPMLFIYYIISKGVDIAKRYSGEFGDKVQGFVSGTVGGVGGVIGGGIGLAAGASAYAGTRLGSRIGKAVGGSTLGKWAANNADSNKAARFFNNTLSKSQTGSWDFRKTKLSNALTSGVGTLSAGQVKLNDKMSGVVGLDSKRFEGGFKAMQKTRQDEIKESIKKRIQYDHLSDDQTKLLWKQHQNKKAEEQALKNFAEKKSTAYKASVDEVKAKEGELKTKKKTLEDKQKELETKKFTLNDTEVQKLKEEIETAKKEFYSAKKDISGAKKKAEDELSKVRATDYKNDAAYASARDEAQKKKEEDDKKTFGKVENVGEYNNAMRREYAQNRRDNSLWMKDGEPRGVLAGMGAGAGTGTFGAILAGAGAAVTTSIAGAIGVLAEERIAFEQEALDAATKSFIKDYGKKKGKDSREEQLEKKVKEYEKTINDTVKDQIKKEDEEKLQNDPSYKVKTDQELEEEVKAMDNDKKNPYFNNHIEDLQAEYDYRNTQYEKSQEYFNDGTISADDLKMVSRARKKAEDELNKAKNAWKDKDKTEADLEKEKEKNKDK